MKKSTIIVLLLASIPSFGFSQIAITDLGAVYSQNFDSLANTGTSSTTPHGWQFLETGTNANTTYAADNGTANSGNTYSYGSTGSTERAFGTLQSGSLNAVIGASFSNNSSSVITSITINYSGEEWRLAVINRTDQLDFQYSTNATSLGSGTWVDVNELDFVTPNTSATVGALDGNNSANKTQKSFTITNLSISPGSTFYIRWTDLNISGNDDGLAIDDLTMSFNGSTLPPCTTPTAQPNSLTFGTITNTSITGSFTAASPAPGGYLVVVSTSNTLSANPQNGTTYSEGESIGNATVVSSSGTTSFTQSSLAPGTAYYFYVFSYNSSCSGAPFYNTTSPLTASASTTTPPACAPPTSAPGALTLTPANTSVNGTLGAAAGADGYLVIRSTNASFAFTPANGTSYAVGQTVGAANDGTVIKFSEGTSFSSTGLTPNTTYYFFAYSVSNFTCTGGPLYNNTATSGNTTTTNTGTGEPAGYYITASNKSCAELKTTLKTIITTGNTPKSYNDLWAQYLVSDIKPREVGPGTSPTVIWDVYSDNPTGPDPYNFTPGSVSSGGQQDNGSSTTTEGQFYNREHSVPLSWFSGSTNSAGPGTDYLHIFPTDKVVNAVRSNYIYGEVATPSYTSANGSKLGTSAIAGFTGEVFEPINEYKGDLARAFLYFVTRYQDNMPGWPGGNGAQAFDPTTYPSVDVPYLQLMIKWHNQDPVSQKEMDRNNAAFSFQGNRNPYVDSPQYVTRVWNANCPGLSALPVHIIFFSGKLVGDEIKLEWLSENEVNFDRFEVERSFNGTSYIKLVDVQASNLRNYSYSDHADAVRGKRVYYRLKKVDKDGRHKYSEVFTLHVPLNTKFTVYPNPATTYIQLQLNKNVNGNIAIQLTDALGKVLKQQKMSVNGNNVKLNTETLAAGTYLVKLLYNGEQYIQKVVVVK